MLRALLALALLLACGSAHAIPAAILALVSWATVQTAVVYLAAAYSVYSGVRARSAAKRAERQAKEEYNASLQGRMVTALSEAPPDRYVYGAGIYGGDVVAIFTSDKVKEDGSVKPDGYKHLVIVNAAHRIKAIKDILIDGTRLGITGAAGWATHAEFAKAEGGTQRKVVAGNLRTATLNSYSGGRIVDGDLSPTVIVVSVARDFVGVGPEHQQTVPPGDYSLSGTTLTLPNTVGGITMTSDWTWYVSYGFYGGSASRVYASKFLGSSTQTADAYLMGVVPSEWTSTDRLRGLAGAVITLDLEEPRFQGGIPNLTFDLEGSDEIYDPRDGLTKYTTNAALVLDDYMRKRLLVTPNTAATIVAANACDVSTTFATLTYPTDGIGPPSSTSFTGPRYTICGGFSDASDKDAVLLDMSRAMAGKVVHGADWRILAGTWTAPVRDIVDGDDMGPVQILQAGEAIEELFNGVRGSFIPYGDVGTADLNPPYSNATFVTADGEELWEDITLPYTDHGARARNIARVMVELSRNGLVIVYPAKIKHWDLEVGQRVRVTNAEYGWTAKEFQILNWDFSPEGAVMLTMQEDNEAAYDIADAAVIDPTPNTSLPSPYIVAPLTGLTLAASTAELLRRADGTIVARVRATWAASTAAYMQDGRVEVAWQVPALDPVNWRVFGAGGRDTEALIEGVSESQTVMVRLTAVNSIGTRSDPVFAAIGVAGKNAAPANVAGLSAVTAPGAVLVTRTPSTEADYSHTEFRYGASFAAGTRLPGVGDSRSHSWPWPSAGAYTVWAVDYDTTGHASTAVSTTVTVDATILIGASEVDAPPEWLNSEIRQSRNLVRGFSRWSVHASMNLVGEIRAADGVALRIPSTSVNQSSSSQTLALAYNNDTYTVSFVAWVASGTRDLRVDLSPDTLPETVFSVSNVPTLYKASWLVNHADAASCVLRFFAEAGADAYIYAPQLEYGEYTSWKPANEDVVSTSNPLTDANKASLGYSGDLNATVGAPLGTNVGGVPVATVLSSISTAQSTADGKIDSFYQTTAPGSASEGDIWFDTDDGNKQYVRVAGVWVVAADTRIGDAITAAAGAQATADGKVTTFYQTGAPTATAVGDLWVDTDDNNQLHRWSGSAWLTARDGTIAGAISAAAAAQSTADGKIDSFYQTTAPGSASEGDIWFDTDDGNRQYTRVSGVWVVAADTRIGTAITAAAGAQATADGKIVTFYQTSTPTATAVGDLWVDTDDGNKLYRWSGSAWLTIQDAKVPEAIGKLYARPNLLVNGGFEAGYVNWEVESGFVAYDGVWGRVLASTTTASGTGDILSDVFSADAGVTYTVAGDSLLFASGGTVYFDLQFYSDAGGTVNVLDGGQNAIGAGHDFSANDTNRNTHAVSATAPGGTVCARARFVWESLTGCTAVGCRLVKVERGGLPATPYSNEASVAAARATADAAALTADWSGVVNNDGNRPANGATVGAVAGTNLKDSGGTVLSDAAVKNSAITIGSNGLLSGAGGGQVTLEGIAGAAVTASIGGGNISHTHSGTGTFGLGNKTLTAGGGSGTYSYAWSMIQIGEANGATIYLSGENTATCTITSVLPAAGSDTGVTLRGVVTDSNGRSASAQITVTTQETT